MKLLSGFLPRELRHVFFFQGDYLPPVETVETNRTCMNFFFCFHVVQQILLIKSYHSYSTACESIEDETVVGVSSPGTTLCFVSSECSLPPPSYQEQIRGLIYVIFVTLDKLSIYF